ncbi:MAG: LD-carboxypeptidase [Cytophagales bacterium]|nr:MAG: LD-carboxypeptidase [Cytophagales bacterium]TAF61622.1 MAG: LD-carboxypeptidase [Cytophagales bacterium]
MSQSLKVPPPLRLGDSIALVAPAGAVKPEKIQLTAHFFKNAGFKPCFFPSNTSFSYQDFYEFSAPDEIRAEAFKEAVLSDCKAIWCLRGGYGCIRLANQLEESIKELALNPKWLIGFSDITFLHGLAQKHGLVSLHAAMPNAVLSSDTPAQNLLSSTLDWLTSEGIREQEYTLKPFTENKLGFGSGSLVGGNLSLLASVLGTRFQMNYANKILFLEEVDEPYYKIDRMLHQMKFAGCFELLAGLVVGHMAQREEPVRKLMQELFVADTWPIAFGLSVGHIAQNELIPHGAKAYLEVNHQGSQLKINC